LKDFHQKHNKESRILSQSGWCQEHIRFIVGWNYKHPTFFEDLYNYNKEGGNEHDDAQDALTGVAEMVQGSGKIAGFVNIK
jgi:predicted phage terminase large subunit-like protein